MGTYGPWNDHQHMRREVIQPAQRVGRKKLVNLLTQNSSAQSNHVGRRCSLASTRAYRKWNKRVC